MMRHFSALSTEHSKPGVSVHAPPTSVTFQISWRRQALHRRHDEARGGVRLDPAAPDDVELHPAPGEPPEVVKRRGQVPGEAVEV